MLRNAIWLFVLSVFLLVVFLPSYIRMRDLREKNQEYLAQIRQLKKKNAELKEEQRRLTEDPEYLEKVVRDKMGLIREGETVYQITPARME